MSSPSPSPRGLSWVDRFLGLIEKVGNLLPHPVTLFAIFALMTIVVSGIGAGLGWSVTDPRPEEDRNPDGLIHVVSLADSQGLRMISTGLVKNFTDFAPLGTVLVALLGVGVAEHSGLLSAAIRALVFGVRREFVTVAVVFAGILSNAASEIGYVVLIPLGAAIYHSLGRHPLAGLAAAYAGVSGGYSANLLLGTVDPLLVGISEPAARMYAPGYGMHAACNWYFMIGSTFLVTAVGSWVSMAIVEPRLGSYSSADGDQKWLSSPNLERVSDRERLGLWVASITFVLFSAVLVYLCLAIDHDQLTGIWAWLPWFGALGVTLEGKNGPVFLDSVVAIIFLAFLLPGLAYGYVLGTVRSDKDIIESMSKSMTSMGSYIVLVFFAAQFVKFFEWTNLGTVLAVLGADAIIALKMDNAGVFVLFILLCAVVNLIMGSSSAKWAFMAPIFVPMLMRIGYSPELIQCAYRIGDSCTNVISPMMSYFGMIFVFASRYDRRFGMGSIISLMFPYAVVFMLTWIVFFYLWVFALGLPIGPRTPIYHP